MTIERDEITEKDVRFYLMDRGERIGAVRVTAQADGNAQFSELESAGGKHGAAMLIQRGLQEAKEMGLQTGVFWTENAELAATISGTRIFKRAVFEVKVNG